MMMAMTRWATFAAVGLLILWAVVGLVLYNRRFLGSGWGALWALGALAAGAALSISFFGESDPFFRQMPFTGRSSEIERVLAVVCHGAVVIFAIPLAIRLFNKWTGRSLTDAEKVAGGEGVRAWLSPGNVVLAVLVSLCAWQGYQYSFWVVLGLTAGLVLAYPVVNMLSRAGGPDAPPAAPADLSAERERVLKLLEEGKVTAEEGAELLNALGETVKPAAAAPAVSTPGRKLMLIGGAIVLVGFFLPWFSVNLGAEMKNLQNQVGKIMPALPMPTPMPTNPPPGLNGAQGFNMTVRATGGDVRDHLGWIVLLLALGAAILPYVAANIRPASRKAISLVALGAGAVILLYLLTGNLRHVSAGLLVVMAGYVLEFLGVVRDRPAA